MLQLYGSPHVQKQHTDQAQLLGTMGLPSTSLGANETQPPVQLYLSPTGDTLSIRLFG